MVLATLRNARLYAPLGPRIARGLAFLEQTNFARAPAGRVEIDGNALYATVSDYTTKPVAEGRWEAHRRYIDLQYVARGVERIGVAPLDRLTPGEHLPEKDLTWLSGHGDYVTVAAGQFAILWPDDAHMPGIEAGAPGQVRKVVVKIAVE